MRVIGGYYRGHRLKAPQGKHTRPTEDRIKENIFNLLSYDYADFFFLDLFSGSGSLGIELLSRGAKQGIFVDKNRSAVQLIKSNLELLNIEENAEVWQMDYKRALNQCIEKNYSFDCIFLDPPYDRSDFYLNSLKAISNGDLLNKMGKVVIEKDKNLELELPEDFTMLKERKYGNTVILILTFNR